MKTARQQEILSIISMMDVETQEQLLSELRERGFKATQATISRDVKDLGLVKEVNPEGSYRYIQNSTTTISGVDVRLANIFREGVISAQTAQNLVVIKTMPGLASAACSALDSIHVEGMIGSLAGDDTGLLIMRDNAAAQHFLGEIHRLFET